MQILDFCALLVKHQSPKVISMSDRQVTISTVPDNNSNSSSSNGNSSEGENPNPDKPNSDPEGGSTGEEGSVTTAEFLTSTELTTIREYVTDEPSDISAALYYCKRRILHPYLRVLGGMGLKPTLNPDCSESSLCIKLINKGYFVMVVLLLFSGYALQYLTCFRRDRGFVHNVKPLTHENVTVDDTEDINNSTRDSNDTSSSNSTAHFWTPVCQDNLFLIHFVPCLLHLFSFVYMVYLYRFCDDEQLPNLMERVYIQAAQAQRNFFPQKKLLRTLQWLILGSVLWLAISTTCQLTQIAIHKVHFNFNTSSDGNALLLGTLALSTTWQDCLQVTIIISYCFHCILLTTFLDLLYSRVQHRSITLSQYIKEVGEIKQLTNYLNNNLSIGMAPLLVLDSATAFSSVGFLVMRASKLHTLDLISLVSVTILWILLFIFPLAQAAILSAACKKANEIGHVIRLRPFGYQDTPQEDLDSFLLFVTTMQMDVRIVKIPVSTGILTSSGVVIVFLMLLWGLFLSSAVDHIDISIDKFEIQQLSPP